MSRATSHERARRNAAALLDEPAWPAALELARAHNAQAWRQAATVEERERIWHEDRALDSAVSKLRALANATIKRSHDGK